MQAPGVLAVSRANGNVWKSYAYSALMDLGLTAPIWVLYLRDERGLSVAQITAMEVPLFLLIVIAEVPTGAVADHFGRKTSLMLGSAILGVSVFVLGVATTYPMILVSNLIWGLAFTFRSGADSALLYDSLKEAGREADFDRINGRFWALRSASWLAGLLVGAPLAAATSFTTVYIASAGCAALAVAVAATMHEPRIGCRAASTTAYAKTLLSGVGDVWRDRPLRYLFVSLGVIGASAAGPLILLQQPWLTEHGVRLSNVGAWQAVIMLAEIAAAVVAVRILAAAGERRSFLALPLATFVFVFALAAVDARWIVTAFLGVSFLRGIHHPLSAGYVNRRIDSSRRATILSVQSQAGNLAMACAWPAAGLLVDAQGVQGAFLMYAGFVLVGGGGAALLWARADARESRALPSAESELGGDRPA